MKTSGILLAVSGLSLAGVLFAQTTSQSTSTSRSGNGQASGYATSSSSASGSKSSSANARGGHSASGSAMGSGFQGKPTHAILYTLGNGIDTEAARMRVMNAHLKYLGDLQGKGVLFFGPWRDMPGSMAIVMVRTDEQAERIAADDPAVKGGGLTYEVRAWNVMAPDRIRQ